MKQSTKVVVGSVLGAVLIQAGIFVCRTGTAEAQTSCKKWKVTPVGVSELDGYTDHEGEPFAVKDGMVLLRKCGGP